MYRLLKLKKDIQKQYKTQEVYVHICFYAGTLVQFIFLAFTTVLSDSLTMGAFLSFCDRTITC